MSSSNVRIRVKAGVNEAEIEGPLSEIKELISLLPNMIASLPFADERKTIDEKISPLAPLELPELKIDKRDSLTNIISKIFLTPWGKQTRKLNEVRQVLESYGLIYPKQSVAVALLRLAQAGKLRRFKGEEGEYVYTASAALSLEVGQI
ncbi:MAG: hypothetical protein QXX95_06820 [Nitrososphaerales archaeon]